MLEDVSLEVRHGCEDLGDQITVIGVHRAVMGMAVAVVMTMVMVMVMVMVMLMTFMTVVLIKVE